MEATNPTDFAAAWLFLAVLDADTRLPPSITSPESVHVLAAKVLSDLNLFKAIRPHLVPITTLIRDIPDTTAWIQLASWAQSLTKTVSSLYLAAG